MLSAALTHARAVRAREADRRAQQQAARAFVVRTLCRLGLNFEPLRAGPGRPAGS